MSWQTPQDWAGQHQERTVSKLRKLVALMNDPGSTEGERAGCRAAIERLRQYVTPAQFTAAMAGTSEEAFLQKVRERQQRDASQRRAAMEKAAKQQRDEFARRQSAREASERQRQTEWENANRLARYLREAAYPKAYDRRK